MRSINCETYDKSDENVFLVKRMKTMTEIILYVFSNDIEGMERKDFKDDTISDVIFIDKAVYRDDTIYNIKCKISSSIDEPLNSIYMFQEKILSKENKDYVIHDFLRSAFRKKSFMTTSRFNRLLNMFFVKGVKSISYRTDADIIRFDQAKELLTKKKSKVLKNVRKYYQCVSYTLKDPHEIDVVFSINPFGADQMEDTDYNTSINRQNELSNTDIGSLNTSNEIYIVCQSDYDEYVSEMMGTHKENINKFYFKETKGNACSQKYKKLLDKMDIIKNEVNSFDYKGSVHSVNCRLVDVKLTTRPLPKQYISKKNKNVFETNTVNLRKVFHLLNASPIAPFISYKGRNNEYYYRVLKYGLPDLISKRKYDKWITQERRYVKDRNNDSISIKTITQDNIVSSVVLKESGNYDIYSKFPATKNVELNYLDDLLTNLNATILKDVNALTKSDDTGIMKFDFNVNGSLAEYKTIALVTTNEKIATKTVIMKRFEKHMYFSLIKDAGNNELLLKYKRVSNYAEMDSITGFMNGNYNLQKDALIDRIMTEFNLDKDTATNEWEQRKDDVQLQLINNNGHISYQNKYTEGILVRLKILNHNQLEIHLQNATRADYHNNIVKVIVLTVLRTEKMKFSLDDTSRKLLEEVTDDNMENNDNNFTMALLHQVNKPTTANQNQNQNSVNNEDEKDDEDDNESIISADSLDLSSASPINDFTDDEEVNDNNNDDNDDDADDGERLMSNLSEPGVVNTEEPPNDDETKSAETLTELREEFNDANMDDTMMKRYHTKFINERLKNADRDLFVKGYATHCGAVDKKQPVVLTKSEKAHVDAHNRDAYTGFIKTGSTPELTNRNYYICPLIWCPLSKVAMTFDELKENGNLCPKPNQETPLILHNKKDTAKKALGDYKKYPYLMKENLHPAEKKMVCCGYKPNNNVKYEEKEDGDVPRDSVSEEIVTDDKNNENTNRYIRKIVGLPVETDRLASLPLALNNILNPGKTLEMCSGLRNDSKNNCYIRLGLGLNIKNRFLNAMVNTLNNPKAQTVNELVELVNNELSLHEYVMLNNGNTMKTYVPYTFNDHNVYEKYRKYIKSLKGQKYIRALNLYDIFEYVSDNEVLDINHAIYKRIKRELTIFSSFENFKSYMRDERIEKDVDEMYGLTKLHFLNPNKLAYIILDTTDEEDITILCQKYSLTDIDNSSKCLILLKNGIYYELLVRNRSCCSNETLKEPLSMKDDGVRELINIYKSNCNFVGKNVKLNANHVYLKLLDLHRRDFFDCKDVKETTPGNDIVVVLNYNVRIVGFFIKPTGFYIPLENEEYVTRFFFDEICGTSNSAVYMDDMAMLLNDRACNNASVYKKVLNELKSVDMFYDDISKDGERLDTHISIQDEIDEELLNLFIGYVTDDARLDFMNEYERLEEDKLDFIKLLIEKISDSPMIRKRIDLIRHDLNPYPEHERIQQMQDLLEALQIEKDVSQDLLKLVTTEFYNKGTVILEKMMYANPSIDMNIEILYTLKDLMSDTLYEHYLMSENPYKELKNSIEDMVMEYKVLTLRSDEVLSDDQYTFLKVKPDDIYNSKKIHPLMMATIFDKSNSKDIFLTMFDKINQEVYQNKNVGLTDEYIRDNHVRKIREHYTTNDNKKLIRYWMNVLNQNEVKIRKPDDAVVITNDKNKMGAYRYNVRIDEDISQTMLDDNYKWGLLELSFMCNAYSLGLIIVSRTRVNPSKSVDVEIRDNMELVLPAKNGDMESFRYVLVFITNNTELNSPYYFMLKSREKRYEQLVYSWNELTPTMQNMLNRNKTDAMSIFDKMYK